MLSVQLASVPNRISVLATSSVLTTRGCAHVDEGSRGHVSTSGGQPPREHFGVGHTAGHPVLQVS